MKAPCGPGPPTADTGSRHVKSTVLIAVGPRPRDQVGLGGMLATGEIEGACCAAVPPQAPTTTTNAMTSILMRLERPALGPGYCRGLMPALTSHLAYGAAGAGGG